MGRFDPSGAGDRADPRGGSDFQTVGYDDGSGRLGVRGAWQLLRRNLVLIAFVVGAVMAIAVAVIFSLDERYSARATIVLEPAGARVALPDPILEAFDVTRARVETEIDILTSQDFAGAVAARLDLFRDPAFTGVPAGSGPATALPETREQTINKLLSSITVFRNGESMALDIVAIHEDPETASAIANGVAAEYIDQSLAVKRDSVANSITFLTERVDEMGAGLAESEIELAAFIRNNELDDTDLSNELRADVERRMSILELSRNSGTAVEDIARLEEELANVQLRLRERTRAELTQLSMERALETERTRYQTFVESLNQLEAQKDILQPGARQISFAQTPTSPTWPNTNAALAMSFAGAVAIAFVTALLREGADRRVWSETNVARAAGLQNLAQIPHLDKRALKEAGGVHAFLSSNPRTPFGEAIRSLLTFCEASGRKGESKVIMVTSGLPDEGKSTIALALAHASKTEGFRTLLIDFDVHRRGASRLVGLDDPEYTMEELWKNSFLLRAEINRNSEQVGLDVLSFARNSPLPRHLLAPDDQPDAWQALKLRYDMIILDTAPLLVVEDTNRLAKIVDSAILVARWGRTTEESLRDSAELMRRNGAVIGGAVINDVDVTKQVRYGYGGYASYSVYGKEYYR